MHLRLHSSENINLLKITEFEYPSLWSNCEYKIIVECYVCVLLSFERKMQSYLLMHVLWLIFAHAHSTAEYPAS
jgi:hypothetical protein